MEFVLELDVPEELRDFAINVVDVAEEQLQLLINKQLDYGPGNINAFGELGVLVRCSDKVERLKNLYSKDRTPAHESVDDSWKDLGNYPLIAQMIRKGVWPE